jgi:hypothetical protein
LPFGWAGGRGEGAGEVAPVGPFGFQRLFGPLGAGALGGGQRGDGLQLCLVLLAEGAAFAGGVGADPVCFGAGVGFGLPGAGDLGVGATAASAASSRSRRQRAASAWAVLTCL